MCTRKGVIAVVSRRVARKRPNDRYRALSRQIEWQRWSFATPLRLRLSVLEQYGPFDRYGLGELAILRSVKLSDACADVHERIFEQSGGKLAAKNVGCCAIERCLGNHPGLDKLVRPYERSEMPALSP